MFALGKSLTFATHFVRNLRGGSQPNLVQATDGLLYVVKFRNNLQGPNVLCNESTGSELYRACGLTVPDWKPIYVTDAFLDRNRSCWIQTPEGSLRPEAGQCFASRYQGVEGVRLLEILPGSYTKRIRNHTDFWLAWLIDVCADHVDNRQALFMEDAAGSLSATFIDHGHLFGGPKGEQRKAIFASRYLDSRVYGEVTSRQFRHFKTVVESLNVDQLWRRVQALPEVWKEASAINRLAECLDRLSNTDFVQGTLDSMAFSLRGNREEHKDALDRRKPPASVLCSGVQAAEPGPRRASRSTHIPACA